MRRVRDRRAAIAPILEHDEYALAITIESDYVRRAIRSPIDANRVGAQPCGLRHDEERARRIPRQLEEQLALSRIDVNRNEPIRLLETCRSARDRCRHGGRGLLRRRRSAPDK